MTVGWVLVSDRARYLEALRGEFPGKLVAATCGSAVVVARRHASSQPRVARLAASLREAGVNVIGGVLLDF